MPKDLMPLVDEEPIVSTMVGLVPGYGRPDVQDLVIDETPFGRSEVNVWVEGVVVKLSAF
ncbi:hypothetical protein BGZ90_011779 [Linnemannia elongata]|nr:hypothetical protein BGZ90_011779 [Linnemannia elongata]